MSSWRIHARFLFVWCSYQERYWKKFVFDTVDRLKVTLDRIYGEGQVSPTEAAFRWLYNYSKMDGNCDGNRCVFGSQCLKIYRELLLNNPIVYESSCLLLPDAVVIGISSKKHLEDNLRKENWGPLHEGERMMLLVLASTAIAVYATISCTGRGWSWLTGNV